MVVFGMGTTLLASVRLRLFAQALTELHPCLSWIVYY